MGDILTLVERAQEHVDQKQAAKLEEKLRKGAFTLDDMLDSMQQMQKMGPLGQVMSMIPGMGNLAGEAQAAVDRGDLKRTEAIIRAMTRAERRDPDRPQQLAPAAHRRRLGDDAAGRQPAGEAVPRDAEAHEAALRRRPTGRPRRIDGPALSRQKGTTMTDERDTDHRRPDAGRRRPAGCRHPTPTAGADTGRPADGPADAGEPGRPRRRRLRARGRLGVRAGPGQPGRAARQAAAPAAAASAGRSASPSSRSSSAPRRRSPRSSPGARRPRPSSATSRQTRGVRRGPPRPARRPARRPPARSSRKFPGFADQAALETKLDEVLDQLVKDATERRADLHDGHQAVVRRRARVQRRAAAARAVASERRTRTVVGSFRALALLSIKDPALAQAWFDAAIAKTGATTTTETYNGATLTVFEPTDGVTSALAIVDGKVAAAGDIASVKAAVDTKGNSGFASEPGPKAALDSVDGRPRRLRLRRAPAVARLVERPEQGTSDSALGGVAMEGISDALLKLVPEWAAYWLRFESDALVMEATRASTGDGDRPDREPQLDDRRARAGDGPRRGDQPTTSARRSRRCSTCTRTDPAFKPIIDQLDQALDLVGGADARVRLGRRHGHRRRRRRRHPGGRPDRRADRRGRRRRSCSRRCARSSPSVAPRSGQPSRTRPTTARRSRSSTSATSASCPGWPAARPPRLPVPTGNVEIAYAVTDKVVVIGSGPDFVKARARHDPVHLARLERDLQDAGRPGRHRHRRLVRRPRQPSAG